MEEQRVLSLSDRANELSSRAKAENRDLTSTEAAELDGILIEFDEYRNRQQYGTYGRRTEPDPVAVRHVPDTRLANEPAMPRGVVGRKTAADIFGAARGHNGGFRDFGDFIRTVGNGLHHPGLQSISADFAEGTGESGGFMVPTEYSFGLINQILEKSVVLSACEIYPMATNALTVPFFDYSNHGEIGGFSGFEWLAENQTATDQTGRLKSLSLHAHKAGIYTAASLELVSDAGAAFTSKLEQALTDSAAQGIDETLLTTGTGVGQPLSVLNSASLITAAAEGGQAADTITWNNVLSMYVRLIPSAQSRGSWYVHTSTIPQLFKMAMLDNANAILGPAFDATFKQTGAGTFSLLGRPVVVTEKLPVLGDVGDIVFCDMSEYVVGMRRNISIERSIHAGWQKFQEKYRLVMRLDGTAKNDTVVTPLHGSTLSWAVALAAR